MSEVFVTAFTPALGSGTGLRTYGVVAALAQRREVELAYVPFGGAAPAPEYGELERVRMRPLSASRGPGRALAYLGARRRGVPDGFARGVSRELARAADHAPARARVIADGPVVAGALLPLARRREVVYLAHNLESGFRAEGPGWARFERDLLRTFSESWMATRADELGARQLAGAEVRTRYVPNVVDVRRILPVSRPGEGRILFVGDFTYEPNREGLRFLVEEVMPQVWRLSPETRVLVVGRGLSAAPGDARVEVAGFVEDLRSAYAGCDIVAVPLLHGGGSPLKFVEALAYGLPVVATAHASGLLEEGVAGEHFVAAGDAREFGEAIVRLLGDAAYAQRLGGAGRELATRCYSVETLVRLLE